MSRCKACNKRLSITEMEFKKLDGTYEDLCINCLSTIYTNEESIHELQKELKSYWSVLSTNNTKEK